MQEPMLYTFTRWLCYNTDTSIDPTFYNCHHQGIIQNNDALSFDVLSLFVLVLYSFNTTLRQTGSDLKGDAGIAECWTLNC